MDEFAQTLKAKDSCYTPCMRGYFLCFRCGLMTFFFKLTLKKNQENYQSQAGVILPQNVSVGGGGEYPIQAKLR